MNTLAAIDLLMALLVRAQQISVLVATAQAEGRELSQSEWSQVIAADDAARADLVAAIKKAEDEGR